MTKNTTDELREQIEVILGVSHIEGQPTEEVAELLALISNREKLLLDRVEKEVVGEKEYYHEHYPFVRTVKMQEEVEEKIARDELRVDQKKALATLRKELDGKDGNDVHVLSLDELPTMDHKPTKQKEQSNIKESE